MRILKWVLKIPAFVLMLATGLLRWIASFAVAMSHWVFYLAASALFCLGLCATAKGYETLASSSLRRRDK